MKKLLCMSILLSLAACGGTETKLVCGKYSGSIKVIDSGDKLKAKINGKEAILEQATSASGARYTGLLGKDKIELWNKGQDNMLIVNDGKVIDCLEMD